MAENTTETIQEANEAAEEGAAAAFEKSLSNLTERIRSASVSFDEIANKQVQPTAPVAAAPTFDPEKFSNDLTDLAKEKGFGPAAHKLVNDVVLPIFNSNLTAQAKANRRELMRDTSEMGTVFNKPEVQKKIDAYIKANRIGDAYLGDKGYDEILKVVAFDELADERAARKAAAEKAKATLTPGEETKPRVKGPASERPHVGSMSSAAPKGKTREDEIAAIEVSDEHVQIAREFYGMDKKDVQRQRWEIQNWEERVGGKDGIRQLGGTPICSLQDVMPRYADTKEPMKIVKEAF